MNRSTSPPTLRPTVSVVATFAAKYPGTCHAPACELPFGAGDRVVRLTSFPGERAPAYVHARCLPAAPSHDPKAPRCVECLGTTRVVYGGWEPPNYRRKAIRGVVCSTSGCPGEALP